MLTCRLAAPASKPPMQLQQTPCLVTTGLWQQGQPLALPAFKRRVEREQCETPPKCPRLQHAWARASAAATPSTPPCPREWMAE